MAVATAGAIAALAFIVLTAFDGPRGLWPVVVGLVVGASTSAAIGLIGTRSVTVEKGRLEISGGRPHGDIALWDHSESSPGAHRSTLVPPTEVSGRRAVPLLHGRVAGGGAAIEGTVFDAVASHADQVVMLIDLARGPCPAGRTFARRRRARSRFRADRHQ